MDAIETAIRNAFEKGDPLDPAYRQRVYRSVIAAMERALEANPSLTPEAADGRRDDVRETIQQIESEFVPAVAVETSSATAFAAPTVDFPGHAPPPVEADRRIYEEPRLDAGAPRRRADDAAPVRLDAADGGRRRQASKGRSPLWRLLPVAVVILFAGAAVWWAASSGLFQAPEAGQEAAPANDAGPAAQPESTAGGLLPGAETSQNWITVFSPTDPTQVSAPANASAEVLEDESGAFMRIRSGSDGAPVGFGIGQGILERIAGRSAVFNIVARAEETVPTEIAVECDFAGLGDCGRKRYQANYERGDFLFEVELPDSAPAAGGSIAITSDVENAGKAIDVYEIRVSVTE